MPIQRKRLRGQLGLAAVVVGMAAVIYTLALALTDHSVSSLPRRVLADEIPFSGRNLASRLPSVNKSSTDVAQSANYKKDFANSHDYWILAVALLPAAKAGNADAQFYLSRLLDRCAEDNRMYFQHKGRNLTLDEGLQYAVQRHLPIEIAQSVYDKCHGFQENDSAKFGRADEWLAKATASGQPIAQATTASKILTQEMQRNFAQAGGVPNPYADESAVNGSDPRDLLRSALRSRDPEVLFSIGESQALLDPTNANRNTTRFAWWLVACERGFDCSANADWVKTSCSNDPQCASATNSDDIVRTLAGDNWPMVQQQAQEISAKLDAGQWDQINLGPTT